MQVLVVACTCLQGLAVVAVLVEHAHDGGFVARMILQTFLSERGCCDGMVSGCREGW